MIYLSSEQYVLPEIPYTEWKETLETVHLWMQIIGKIKLELAPFLNQWWEVAFHVTATGLTSGEIPYKGQIFHIDFDFFKHIVTIQTSWKKTETLPLEPVSVADFYKEFMNVLKNLGIRVHIWPIPVEVPNPISFTKDTIHSSYEKIYVERWWHSLVKVHIIFEQFRSSFRGKSCPIQFFWGSFDLNGTRFSGKLLPDKTDWPKGYSFMRYAENEENFSFGFWPGDQRFPYPAFYSYLYPQPLGIESIVLDDNASFNRQLGEFILPYEAVRNIKDPKNSIVHFLESAYEKSAKLAKWDTKRFRTAVPIIH